jgi:hypothetical protein
MQSTEEVFRIIKDWDGLGYAPKNLIRTEKTAELLIAWVMENEGGVMSFTGLNKAVDALPEVLQRELTPVERAARGDKKMRDAYYESLKPQVRLVDAQNQKGVDKAREKEIQNIRDEIGTAINSHMVTTPNGCNYSKTEYDQNHLRSVLAQHDVSTVENANKALAAVLSAKSTLVRW